MTKYFAVHASELNVRVNAVSPGGIYNNENPDKYTFEYSPDLHPNFNKTIAAFVNDRGGCTDKFITGITREIQIIRGSRPVPRWVLLIWGAVLGVIFFKFAQFIFKSFKGKLK